MIVELNTLIDLIESDLADTGSTVGGEGVSHLDVESLARTLGTSEYHLRRMFSSLAGMSLSEYVRRRRMTVAAADVAAGRGLLGHRGPLRIRID